MYLSNLHMDQVCLYPSWSRLEHISTQTTESNIQCLFVTGWSSGTSLITSSSWYQTISSNMTHGFNQSTAVRVNNLYDVWVRIPVISNHTPFPNQTFMKFCNGLLVAGAVGRCTWGRSFSRSVIVTCSFHVYCVETKTSAKIRLAA